MLQINMADVMNVIGSLTPYLIAIGVLFVSSGFKATRCKFSSNASRSISSSAVVLTMAGIATSST